MLFDAGKLFVGNAFHRDDARALDERARLFCQKLHALRRAVRALVVLPVEEGDRKHLVFFIERNLFKIYVVYGRLGKHVYDGCLELLFGKPLNVVPNDFAHIARMNGELRRKVVFYFLRLQIVLFFNENSVDHRSLPLYLLYLMPISVR